MPHKILIYNPSDYPRGGQVTLAWEPIQKETGFDPDTLLLYQEQGNPLPYQVDEIDPADPSRDTLTFFLSEPAKRGDEHYNEPTAEVTIAGSPVREKARGASPPQQRRYVEFGNNCMDLRLNLLPGAEGGEGFWNAGSIRSVQLEKLRRGKHRKEFLDFFHAQDDLPHDPEKRCAQLIGIEILAPDPAHGPSQRVYLFNQPYRLVSECAGPVRKSVTIASRPFYIDRPSAGDGPLRCELFRVFSLYEDREYLMEELFLQVRSGDKLLPAREVDLEFTAHYFTYMKLGIPHVGWYRNVPDWFAVGDLGSSLLYGFACDVHISSIAHPHPSLPNKENEDNAFSWRLDRGRQANCLHLFSRFRVIDPPIFHGHVHDYAHLAQHMKYWFESRIGHAWYESILKPLRARLVIAGAGAVPGAGDVS